MANYRVLLYHINLIFPCIQTLRSLAFGKIYGLVNTYLSTKTSHVRCEIFLFLPDLLHVKTKSWVFCVFGGSLPRYLYIIFSCIKKYIQNLQMKHFESSQILCYCVYTIMWSLNSAVCIKDAKSIFFICPNIRSSWITITADISSLGISPTYCWYKPQIL